MLTRGRNEMKIIASDKCTFCRAFPESIDHLLVKCVHVQRFWKGLVLWLKTYCKHCDRLDSLTEQIIIFGTSRDFRSDAVFNLILLLAKKYIYRCRCLDKPLNFICFQREIGKRFYVEKYL